MLFTDGHSTGGDSDAALAHLVEAHIPVSVEPLAPRSLGDTWIDDLILPERVPAGAAFTATVHVGSQRDRQAVIGGGFVAEDLAPAAEGLVGGDDQAGAFVAAGDEHEHEVGGVRVEGDVADLVDDQQRDPLQAIELCVEAALALGVGEQRDPFGGGLERDAVAGETGADSQGDAQVGLAGAGRPEQDDVLLAGEEVELAEMQDGVAWHRRWKAKSNSSSVLRAGNRAALIRACAAVAVAAIGLGLQQRLGEAAHSSSPRRGRARRAWATPAPRPAL